MEQFLPLSPETASRNLFCMAAGIVAALLLEVMNEKNGMFSRK